GMPGEVGIARRRSTMRSTAGGVAAAVSLLVAATASLSAQQPSNPMPGVWLLSPMPLPLASLLAFGEDTYSVIGRISYHGAEISFTKRDEDRGPHPYAVQALTLQGQRLSFRLVLDGIAYQAMGPRPGSTPKPEPLHLLADDVLVAVLTPLPELRPAAAEEGPDLAPAPDETRDEEQSADGWNMTDNGAYRIERSWEETIATHTVTHTLISYKNTTQRTFATAVRLKVAVYDQSGRLIGTNTRCLFASDRGAMTPGFVGDIEIPVVADGGATRSIGVAIEAAN
ncbi:MAG: hypothetical protein JXB46_10335, partial [Candidatus Eisenbacteria bacterium]|nr:hypothetical protein [Candidatus Eisenbacteria bacterium]